MSSAETGFGKNKNRRGYTTAVLSKIKRDISLIELSLVLTGGLGLLLTLQAGADVMLALLNFGNNALLGAATLKATQSALQSFVFLNANFRHCFPSLRWHPAKSRMRSGPVFIQARVLYMQFRQLSRKNFLFLQKSFHKNCKIPFPLPQIPLFRGALHGKRPMKSSASTIFYLTIRLTSLFLTTMVLTILPPFFSRNAAIFSLARTLATTVSLSRSAAISTVPRILPLT